MLIRFCKPALVTENFGEVLVGDRPVGMGGGGEGNGISKAAFGGIPLALAGMMTPPLNQVKRAEMDGAGIGLRNTRSQWGNPGQGVATVCGQSIGENTRNRW